WPHTFASAFSAKNEKVFRKNAAIMPLYSLVLLFVFFAGFAAILQVPGLKGADVDLSLFRLALQTFDPWFIGIIGSAGVLTALVPGSMLVMAASTLLAKNIYRTIVPSASDRQVAKMAKLFVPVVTLVAVLFTFKGGETIGALLLMGYSIVTQLFPALVCSLFPRQIITKQGAIAGMGVGLLVVAYITLSGSTIATMFPSFPQYIKDLNVGIVALLINIIVMFVVSGFTKGVFIKKNTIIVEK
ncbi:sodium:solute symporter family transporter, partial [Bacillus thuringiensis]